MKYGDGETLIFKGQQWKYSANRGEWHPTGKSKTARPYVSLIGGQWLAGGYSGRTPLTALMNYVKGTIANEKAEVTSLVKQLGRRQRLIDRLSKDTWT